MALTSYNDFINRISTGFSAQHVIFGERNNTAVAFGNNIITLARLGLVAPLPASLPTGVTSYIVTQVSAVSTQGPASFMLAWTVNLGSLDISTNVFTDGSTMPTVTELGTSRTVWGPVFAEVTTALNATPGSLTITYTDQDGNSTETTTAQTLPVSGPVGSIGFIVLNSRDTGVRDITSAARTSGTTPTGVITFWGIIPISFFAMPSSTLGLQDNLLTSGFNPMRIPNATTLGGFIFGSSNATAVVGQATIVGDN